MIRVIVTPSSSEGDDSEVEYNDESDVDSDHDSFITLLTLMYSAEMSLSLKEYFCTKLLERLDRIDQYLYQIQMMKQPLTWKMM